MSVYEHLEFHAALRMSKGKLPSNLGVKTKEPGQNIIDLETSSSHRDNSEFSAKEAQFNSILAPYTVPKDARLYLGKRLELLSGNSYFEPFLREQRVSYETCERSYGSDGTCQVPRYFDRHSWHVKNHFRR